MASARREHLDRYKIEGLISNSAADGNFLLDYGRCMIIFRSQRFPTASETSFTCNFHIIRIIVLLDLLHYSLAA